MASQYDFTPLTKQRIWEAIYKRWPQLPCPLCHSFKWELAEGFVTLPLMSNYWLGSSKSGLPSAALICGDCGHTLLFNLVALGLRDLVGPDLPKRFLPTGGK